MLLEDTSISVRLRIQREMTCMALPPMYIPDKHHNKPLLGALVTQNFIFLPVYNTTELTTPGSKEQGDRLVLTCTVELREKLSTLLSYVQLQWVGSNGVPMITNNNIIDIW